MSTQESRNISMIDTDNQVPKPKQNENLTNSNMCRACLSQNREVQSLFIVETHSVTSLLDMFTTCTSLEVSYNDGYPKQICKNCIQDLAKAFNFRTKCHNSLKELYVLANNTGLRKVVNIKNEIDLSIVKSESDDSCDVTEVFDHAASRECEQMSPKTEKIQDTVTNIKPEVLLKPDLIQKEAKSKPNKPKNARLKSYKCMFCDKIFNRFKLLKEHKVIHKIVKKCNECRMEFMNIDAYKEHVTTHTYLCPDCGLIFNKRTSFSEHRLGHLDEYPFECKDCEKKYKSASGLSVHKHQHSDEKLYACKDCGKKFITWNSRYNHILSHHTETKAHVCNICNKAFKQLLPLTIHMRRHTGEKPYQCSECLKCFTSSKVRRLHMKIHTGEKNIACTLCDKRFIKRYNLKQHMVTHTGERKHSCEICGKAFTQAHVLRGHMRTHGENYAQRNDNTKA